VSGPVSVLRHHDREVLVHATAARLVTRLVDLQRDGAVPALALTGGTVANEIYAAVAASPAARAVDWARLELWWGDERFVPSGDDDRNDRQARAALLDSVPLDPARVHPMPASDGEPSDLDEAAADYARQLRASAATRFDVVLLGVGPDGHVASLFPGFPQLDVQDTVAAAVRNSPKPPPERISLTFPALERADEIWFLVAGAEKADAVRRALTPAADPHETPAARPRGARRTLWLLDEAAATGLDGSQE
jgi:6-phosphogluconolactonase